MFHKQESSIAFCELSFFLFPHPNSFCHYFINKGIWRTWSEWMSFPGFIFCLKYKYYGFWAFRTILHIVPTWHTDLLVNGGKMGHIKRYALPNAFHSKNPLYILMSLFAKLCTILICKIFENLWYEVIRVRGLGIKWLYSHCYGFQQVDLNQCLASSVFMVRSLLPLAIFFKKEKYILTFTH